MKTFSALGVILIGFGLLTFQSPLGADEAGALDWHTDYSTAYKRAESENKMLLIFFRDPKNEKQDEEFESKTLSDQRIAKLLKNCVLLKLPIDTKIKVDDKNQRLLDSEGFAYMYKQSGIAIVDLKHKKRKFFKHVVSAFPFRGRRRYDAKKVATILDLPAGTITQRTLVYAVRIHPESPQSTTGEFRSLLAHETEKHSQHQANIQNQGHHNWESRFHQINQSLPGDHVASEVCAESWPGEDLVTAAVECVSSWRQSPGHWNGVRRAHTYYGYDMKRGSNGIWYGTGIFGSRER